MPIPDSLSAQIHRINTLTAESDFLYHQAALKLGVSDSMLRVLYTILDQGDGCPLADVCRQSALSKQTVNSVIRQLESAGMLTLAPYRGNAKKVMLTPQGQAYAQQTAGRLYDAEVRVYSDWSEDEVQHNLLLMQKYNSGLRAQLDKL